MSRKWTKSRTRGCKLHLTKTKARFGRVRQIRADLERQLEACKRETANVRERLIEATKQQTATSEMLRIISDSPLQSVLDAVAEHAARLCDSNNAEIYRLENNLLRLVASYGELPVHIQAREGFPANRDRVIGRAVCDRRSVHVHDLAAEDSEYPSGSSDAKRQGHRTTLGTPLLRERTPIGVILFRRWEVRPFSDNQIALLETFAEQAVIAIENVRLFEAEKQRTLALGHANRNLRESEAKYRSAIDGIAGLVAIMAPNGELETVNRQIIEYFGRSQEELTTWETSDAVHPKDLPRILELFKRSIAAGAPFHYELRLRRFDGEYRWFENRGVPIRDESGLIVRWFILLVDIEDRTRALEQMQQMQSDFAHMNRVSMMGELAASLSHEITQPIAAAHINACAALNFLGKQPPDLSEARQALGCIVRDSDRARDIVGRIREQIKKTPPRKERFDLNAAINEVIVLARSATIRNGVSVQTRLAEGLLPVHGDRVQLQQVFLNLILNAVEAMGSVEAGARELSISTEQDHTGVVVAVRDSGLGIDPHHLERVFEAFYTTKSNGTGMGLSICRSIIEAHGGRLWAEANEPRGAVFQFTVPGVGKEHRLHAQGREAC
ncbi:ATP-binding protein [Bradyrhizobium sp. Arg237L]|uniref:ATP-binding protein n=1 Tax=Bradyrhizobium sp. Arg237L TaxID=3003352 RepID=UPI00249EF3AC|nr:ATP-binding protein [Bradyrhizobium sp. Arg237L]MDI4232382.1 ATP-binding protein [Bradyrhizobium sp. Arg237L]